MNFLTRSVSNNSVIPPTRPNSSNSSSSSSYAYRELETTPRATQTSRSVMYTRDWRSALRTPPTYRIGIGNRSLRFNYYVALLLAGILTLSIFFIIVRSGSQTSSSTEAAWMRSYASSTSIRNYVEETTYNSTYPLTPPLHARGGIITYRIGMVADLDTNSKVIKDDGSTVWRSYLKKGYLIYVEAKNDVKLKWDVGEPIALESSFALKGRGMELSELVTFNGRILTFDDRTGLIYEIANDRVIPWTILMDGNGRSAKGFKSEWATVKQQMLYVGSMGKEWTTSMGEFENENPMYVKEVSPVGVVRSLDWAHNFKALRQETLNIEWPGYVIHESGMWSDVHKRWYFLPRRCSKEKYNETRDEYMGCNVLLSADENFKTFGKVNLDEAFSKAPTHGFSSFKFIPGTDDRIIVAIRSEELNGKTSTFITVFDISGKTLLPEQRIDTEYKYEGIEFI